jgi:hypothetical protein
MGVNAPQGLAFASLGLPVRNLFLGVSRQGEFKNTGNRKNKKLSTSPKKSPGNFFSFSFFCCVG